MEIFLILLCIFWVAGWLKQLASIDAIVSKVGFKYPNEQVRAFIPVVLFFTWPYFYYYEKAL